MEYTAQMAHVHFVAQDAYEVVFLILKPRATRTTELVRANSTADARTIINARYGKENVKIQSVKKVPQ